MNAVSVYIHIPFCSTRCSYCDFNTYSGINYLIPKYVQALCNEIGSVSNYLEEKLSIHSIYFGGGTPSLLLPSQYDRLFNSLSKSFNFVNGIEITMEANPKILTTSYLMDLYKVGINRLSLGMQSANMSDLHILARNHTFSDVIMAIETARGTGYENINLDLIYGIPNQTLEDWKFSLSNACKFVPEHLSLYSLTIEENTPLKNKIDLGLIPKTDQDLSADMYEFAEDYLINQGYVHYEISNWAIKNRNNSAKLCVHNLQYWRNLPYLGFGAGAHGFIHGMRTVNEPKPLEYIERCGEVRCKEFILSPAIIEKIEVSRETEISETMFMGLRLVEEGISDRVFYDRFGIHVKEKFYKEIVDLKNKGLLEWIDDEEGSTLRLTRNGRLLGNQVFMVFI